MSDNNTVGDDATFRLTFNAPAEKMFFPKEEFAAIRILVDEDAPSIAFRPAATVDVADDAVEMGERGRGGREVTIDGPYASELLTMFETLGASAAQPFFMLYRMDKGMIGLRHHQSPTAPPKFDPHMRVWVSRQKTVQPIRIDNEIVENTLGRFATVIRDARNIVETQRRSRRPGRPRKEVEEAGIVMQAFEQLAREVLPVLLDATPFLTSITNIQGQLAQLSADILAHSQVASIDEPENDINESEPDFGGVELSTTECQDMISIPEPEIMDVEVNDAGAGLDADTDPEKIETTAMLEVEPLEEPQSEPSRETEGYVELPDMVVAKEIPSDAQTLVYEPDPEARTDESDFIELGREPDDTATFSAPVSRNSKGAKRTSGKFKRNH